MTVSSLSGLKFKILEGPFEGEPDCVTQNFVRIILFFIPTHSENLIHLTPMLQNFKISEDPFEGESPIMAPPIFQEGPCPS